uniref:Uncharacterized protein n=1 Tax=Arundo donax TaxID=35708 RepID=A0A0A9GUK7_ARUDO
MPRKSVQTVSMSYSYRIVRKNGDGSKHIPCNIGSKKHMCKKVVRKVITP